ncbi:DNA glycosylase [Dendrothele bispora CBS 962.96]|uniref:DNA glycosylase n=1 Tax=Dendrothele bispora (strain CBS 962.96) TaxID=1314807 RepID=A0A4S8MR19_DENBC|nr:DNA glycosylase [Dendrothele bispora CBS 962.96]
MPTLRSSTRAASKSVTTTVSNGETVVSTTTSTKVSTVRKRKATDVVESEPVADSDTPTTSKSKGKKKARITKAKATSTNTSDTPDTSNGGNLTASAPEATQSVDPGPPPVLVPAKLTFSFEDAKKHLTSVDPRFQVLFDRLHCKPFEQLEQVHPFRALSTSILGQQISWLAARSIIHKFIRLFDPSIPEKVSDYESKAKSPQSFYPTPHQVANTDIATLKTAGLSTRKAEYVQDLAQRFADGRLSTEKLLEANDEELAEMLIAVRGIGRWTVDMFAIFSLRRPDILPVGDLGVQRGLLRWTLAAHSPTYPLSISPNKLSIIGRNDDVDSDDEDSTLPVIHEESQPSQASTADPVVPNDISSVPPAAPAATPRKLADTKEATQVNIASLPPTFTPSIKQSLTRVSHEESYVPSALPVGLTAAALKSRLDGKKKIKGAILTPQEMNDLTESWKPYRSLGRAVSDF